MPTVTYVEPSGETLTVQLPEDWNLMQGAVVNGVDGIVGECGGSCVCATCHCYVDVARMGELPAPSADESELLSCVIAERKPNSRLACQIKATAAIDGMTVAIPSAQGLR
jgi:ferredoxin, 2Fe-2S